MGSKNLYSESYLEHLVETSDKSFVVNKPADLTIDLNPLYQDNIKAGVNKNLKTRLKRYDRKLNGILLGYKNVKVDINSAKFGGNGACILYKANLDCYIFEPVVGCLLEGIINTISPDHIGCVVHQYFNATILRPQDEDPEVWSNLPYNFGDKILFRVKELDFTGVIPSIEGEIPELRKDTSILMEQEEQDHKALKNSKKERKRKIEFDDAILSSTQHPSTSHNATESLLDFDFLSPIPVSADSKKRKKTSISPIESDPPSFESVATQPKKKKKDKNNSETNESFLDVSTYVLPPGSTNFMETSLNSPGAKKHSVDKSRKLFETSDKSETVDTVVERSSTGSNKKEKVGSVDDWSNADISEQSQDDSKQKKKKKKKRRGDEEPKSAESPSTSNVIDPESSANEPKPKKKKRKHLENEEFSSSINEHTGDNSKSLVETESISETLSSSKKRKKSKNKDLESEELCEIVPAPASGSTSKKDKSLIEETKKSKGSKKSLSFVENTESPIQAGTSSELKKPDVKAKKPKADTKQLCVAQSSGQLLLPETPKVSKQRTSSSSSYRVNSPLSWASSGSGDDLIVQKKASGKKNIPESVDNNKTEAKKELKDKTVKTQRSKSKKLISSAEGGKHNEDSLNSTKLSALSAFSWTAVPQSLKKAEKRPRLSSVSSVVSGSADDLTKAEHPNSKKVNRSPVKLDQEAIESPSGQTRKINEKPRKTSLSSSNESTSSVVRGKSKSKVSEKDVSKKEKLSTEPAVSKSKKKMASGSNQEIHTAVVSSNSSLSATIEDVVNTWGNESKETSQDEETVAAQAVGTLQESAKTIKKVKSSVASLAAGASNNNDNSSPVKNKKSKKEKISAPEVATPKAINKLLVKSSASPQVSSKTPRKIENENDTEPQDEEESTEEAVVPRTPLSRKSICDVINNEEERNSILAKYEELIATVAERTEITLNEAVSRSFNFSSPVKRKNEKQRKLTEFYESSSTSDRVSLDRSVIDSESENEATVTTETIGKDLTKKTIKKAAIGSKKTDIRKSASKNEIAKDVSSSGTVVSPKAQKKMTKSSKTKSPKASATDMVKKVETKPQKSSLKDLTEEAQPVASTSKAKSPKASAGNSVKKERTKPQKSSSNDLAEKAHREKREKSQSGESENSDREPAGKNIPVDSAKQNEVSFYAKKLFDTLAANVDTLSPNQSRKMIEQLQLQLRALGGET